MQVAPQPIVIVGPTAVGKSALGVQLAQHVNGEVVNADSMQLYRGLDVGTGKLPVLQRQGVPHHLLDIWDIDHPASVQEYQSLARNQLADLQRRGRCPIVVGGSGLYVSALLDDLRFPATDPSVRQKWDERLAIIGPQRLHAELAALDPAAAQAILPGNGRRIVRALEVIELTGEPFNASLGSQTRVVDALVIGLTCKREVLDDRINSRVDDMWAQGWVDEVRTLAEEGLAETPTASRALGYQQILELIDGRRDVEDTLTEIKTATRRFARKQLSWFRRDQTTVWLDSTTSTTALSHALTVVADRAANAGA